MGPSVISDRKDESVLRFIYIRARAGAKATSLQIFIGYYHPQTKFAKVMFLHLSVCSLGGGICIQAGSAPHRILRGTVNERAARIPLECILVQFNVYIKE